MIEEKVYNQQGEEVGRISLTDEVFGLPWSNDLIHQVLTSQNARARQNIAYVKGRGDVAGGGRKPWRQKGTGRARHGSNRSPIWIGGGVTHGPTLERSYDKKINKKMKIKALKVALSAKKHDGEIIFIDSLLEQKLPAKKAKDFLINLSKAGFAKLVYDKGKRGLILIPELNKDIYLGFRNFSTIKVLPISDLNLVDTLKYDYLIVLSAEQSVKNLLSRLEK
ncbi:MAG TPA: 50S ribosomal protein L4 [Candidatus Vogelbacteria bacterium]|nr:50S ribosomal protein L4 [Candidatus Vogelbacteria bacterium]